MSAVRSLEAKLEETFTKTLPPLPKGAKDFLVEFAPWLSLIAGVLSVIGVWQMWHWASVADRYTDIYNAYSTAYGGTAIDSRWSIGIWIGLVVLLIQGVLYLLAYKPLAARQVNGWRLVFYTVLVGIAGSVVTVFTAYGGVGRLIGTLIGAAIAFYLLFQVKSRYHEATKSVPKAGSSTPPTT
jgi:hypothetical protein